MFRDSIVLIAGSLLLTGMASAQVGDIAIQPRMGSPVPGLTAGEFDRFVKGKVEFDHQLTNAEGLGPTFNDTGCAQCHAVPESGGGSNLFVTRFGVEATQSSAFDPLDALGGSLLQAHAIDPQCLEFVPPEANVTANRLTPSVFGAGLVQAIPDGTLQAIATGNGGVAHIVQPLEGGPTKVGRFGWKAQVATMLTFSGDASLNEMGLTNALVMTENAPNGNQALLAQFDLVPEPEDFEDGEGFTRIERMDDFQRFLGAPPQTPKSGMTGEALFNSIGCAVCHVPSFTTGAAPEAALSGKVIRPYSDFLLHDMGALGDGIVQGMGTEKLMRTSSLWGLAARAPDGLLHHGGAFGGTSEDNIGFAVDEHDGQAAASRNTFNNVLTEAQRDQVKAFLMSLGQLEFDSDHNNTVDGFDWFFISNDGWFQGPGANNVTPDTASAIADVDQDGDVDLVDFGLLQRAMTPPPSF